jgi:hypothetical protein
MPALWQPLSSVWHPRRSASLPTQQRRPALMTASQAGHQWQCDRRTPQTQRISGAAHRVLASDISSNSNTVRHGQTASEHCVPQGGMTPIVSDARKYLQQNLESARQNRQCGKQIDRPLLCLGSLPFRRTFFRGCFTGQDVTSHLLAASLGLYTAWFLIEILHPAYSRFNSALAERIFWRSLKRGRFCQGWRSHPVGAWP